MANYLSTANLVNMPDTYIGWAEPWPGLNKDGSHADCHVEMRSTVAEVIKMQRAAAFSVNAEVAAKLTDEDLLGEFISVHWANPIFV